VFFTNNAKKVFLRHLAESSSPFTASSIESNLDNYILKKKYQPWRIFPEEKIEDLKFESEILSLLSTYPPFIDKYEFKQPEPRPDNTYSKRILEFTKNDNKIEGVFFTKGILNHWDEELALRTNSEISIGQCGWLVRTESR